MKKGLLVLSFCLLNLNLAFAQSPSCSPSAGQVTLKQAIKWYRDSAEQTALYRQAYNAGTDYVENWVKVKHPQPKTWGVVLDIDETTLDNSWYFFRCDDVADKEADFEHFVTIQQKSVALPGVVEFTHRVHQLGGYVSLVSNRDGSYRDSTGASLAATVANLKQQQVEFDQVILANYKSSPKPTDKNPRFQAVITGRYDPKEMVWTNTLPAHQVIAYFGDNIQDFPKFKQAKMDVLAKNSKEFGIFGRGYFILPNPMYGSWEVNLYH